jgi:GT2 family glycosyltransferase
MLPINDLSDPKVTLIWLNYNSMHVIELAKSSIKSIMELDYPNYETIIVDNGSTDGSFESITEYLDHSIHPKHICKIIRNERNLGFTAGINSGYAKKDKSSRYVLPINNDAIMLPASLRRLVRVMEINNDIGAAQGIVLRLASEEIDGTGGIIDELFLLHRPYLNALQYQDEIAVTYPEGTCPIYRISVIDSFNDRLFITEGMMFYLEDVFNGIMIWNLGYRCVLLPFVVAHHSRAAVISRYIASVKPSYYFHRNRIAILYLSNSKYKWITEPFFEFRLILRSLRAAKGMLQAVVDGFALGRYLRNKYGYKLDIYRAPLHKTSPLAFIFPEKLHNKRNS